MLWPKAVRERLKTGGDREVIQTYPYRSACPSTAWTELIENASEELLFAGYTNYFLWTQVPAITATLRQKAVSGCQVRFLLGDPDGDVTRQREVIEGVALTVSTRIRMSLEELARLADVPQIQVRYSAAEDATNHVSLSVFRFDDQAFITPHLARVVGHDSPLMHVRRRGQGGLFDRFSEHAEELWGRGVPLPSVAAPQA
ncbi:XRE family transcriptional regulator [Streptomyces sp. OM5714]|uniref:XRE family transcriptional regulator n=1 Tax=Streptomyces TaxID=1883 RepID=UPI0019DAE4BB|nr:XRE family transcriptional regulator [Streptomyces sp. OM5714]KAF2779488.1 helix-turn-helix domain-containing protein [Streptomyces sp. OM5714]